MVSHSASDHYHANGAHSEDGTAASDEVVDERLIRELTREHLQLLLNTTEKTVCSQGEARKSCCGSLVIWSECCVHIKHFLPAMHNLHNINQRLVPFAAL